MILLSICSFTFFIIDGQITLADSNPVCTTDSSHGSIISSTSCGKYGIVTSRHYTTSGIKKDVTVQYMVNIPAGTPKALALLLPGGNGASGIAGDASTDQLQSTGLNFLVRSAQLFAEHGYLAVTIDRPSDITTDSIAEFDKYRISPANAQDIVSVISAVNKDNLPVFLVGTSSGAISAVADNRISVGILLSSPVTSGNGIYLGRPNYSMVQASSIKVPTDILVNKLDSCQNAGADNAEKFYSQLVSLGTTANFDELDGGFGRSLDPCNATTYHGFLGIENEAVQATTQRMDDILKNIYNEYSKNQIPIAKSSTLSINSKNNATIDLATLTSDQDGGSFRYSILYPTSSMGAQLSISGSVVTYTPLDTNIVDGFVYVVSDGKGRVSSAVITVEGGQTNQTNITNSSASIPTWVKNNAKWWSEGYVGDSDFVKGIQYLIQKGIITVPSTQASSNPSQGIPVWVKNTAKWWAEGQVGDQEFVKGMKYLVQVGIVQVNKVQSINQTENVPTDQIR